MWSNMEDIPQVAEQICPEKLREKRQYEAQQGKFVTAEALILSDDPTCDRDCSGPIEVPRKLLGVELPVLSKKVCALEQQGE